MQTPPGLELRGIVHRTDVERIAVAALRKAARPPGGDPLVIALELGFSMLPTAPGTAPEWSRTTVNEIVFAAEPGAFAQAERVRLALARGLLLRSGLDHAPGDVERLARRLRQIPE